MSGAEFPEIPAVPAEIFEELERLKTLNESLTGASVLFVEPRQTWKRKRMSSLQDHIETLERYRRGCEPGSCTRAMLAMDLHGTVATADPTTLYHLRKSVQYIVNHLPPESWGSYAKVDAWLKAQREGKDGI
jgi:hypothetical protein